MFFSSYCSNIVASTWLQWVLWTGLLNSVPTPFCACWDYRQLKATSSIFKAPLELKLWMKFRFCTTDALIQYLDLEPTYVGREARCEKFILWMQIIAEAAQFQWQQLRLWFPDLAEVAFLSQQRQWFPNQHLVVVAHSKSTFSLQQKQQWPWKPSFVVFFERFP